MNIETKDLASPAQESTDCCGPTCCSPATATLSRGARSSAPDATAAVDAGEAVRATVRERYGNAARQAQEGNASCCTSGGIGTGERWDPITSDLYEQGQVSGIPAGALLASLGCGNPTALAELHEGEAVLDLGSGGGIDVLLSARRVGPTGKAYGLDMTDEMLALACDNQRASGLTNVEFLRGEIERIPLPAQTVDVVISNCVINLSADKPQVLREAYRVLKPGGRFAVSDVVLRGDIPAAVRASVELWCGCVAGALHEDEYKAYLADAGFTDIDVEPTRLYSADDVRALLEGVGMHDESLVAAVEGRLASAFIRARRPEA